MDEDFKKDEFDEILDSVENEHKVFIDLNLDISEQVKYYLSQKSGINTQKELATKLGKSESEISKWLCGMHNITLESIAKLTDAIGRDIIMTDIRAREKYQKVVYVEVPVYIDTVNLAADAKPIEMYLQQTKRKFEKELYYKNEIRATQTTESDTSKNKYVKWGS